MLQSLFNKVAGLKAWNFIKKRLQHRCFPVKFASFLGTPVFKKIYERLLLLTAESARGVFRTVSIMFHETSCKNSKRQSSQYAYLNHSYRVSHIKQKQTFQIWFIKKLFRKLKSYYSFANLLKENFDTGVFPVNFMKTQQGSLFAEYVQVTASI